MRNGDGMTFDEKLADIETRPSPLILADELLFQDFHWLLKTIKELKSSLEQSETQLKQKSAALNEAKHYIKTTCECDIYYPPCLDCAAIKAIQTIENGSQANEGGE